MILSDTTAPLPLAAADTLRESGIQAAVWNCARVKPLDEAALAQLPAAPILTIEEHSIVGGFGSAVAEFLAANRPGLRIGRLGIPDDFLCDCGDQQEARVLCGLDSKGIAASALRFLGR